MENNIFEIIGKDTRTGISSRTGEPYVIENLTLNFHGKAAKIRAPRDMKIDIGDSVILEFGTVVHDFNINTNMLLLEQVCMMYTL